MTFDRLAFTKVFAILVIVIVVSRIGLAVVTAYFPITNEIGNRASINHPAPSSDLHHYQRLSKLYFDLGFAETLDVIAVYHHDKDIKLRTEARYLISPGHLQLSPPIFPALIWIFDYKKGNTVPLAILFIGFSIVVSIAWAKWMTSKGMPLSWILLFVFLPHSAWFTINLGSDLLFYCTYSIFFFIYFSEIQIKKRLLLSLFAIGLCVLTRPTGASFLLFFLLDQLLSLSPGNRRRHIFLLSLTLIAMSPAVLFLLPYFYSVVTNSNDWPFFGIFQLDYLNGIYADLPRSLDLVLSWLSLFAGKFIYMFGLRPSYGDISISVFLLRSAPGLIFLPGFIHLMWRGTTSEKVLVLSMLAPVMAGPAQDRYLLPLQPLFLYHAWLLAQPLHDRISLQVKSSFARLSGSRNK